MDTHFPWKAPLAADWIRRAELVSARVRRLADGVPDEAFDLPIELRRLAWERLGIMEQLRLEKIARRLWPIRTHLGGLRPFRLGLVGNRTLAFLGSSLRAAGLARGLLVEPVEAPYDGAAALAFGTSRAFAGEHLDAVLLLLDAAAFAPPGVLLDEAAETTAMVAAQELLLGLVGGIRRRTAAPVIVSTLPRPPHAVSSVDIATYGSMQRFILLINQAIVAGAVQRGWLLWDLEGLAADVGHTRWFDPVRLHQAQLPFAVELSPVVADHLCRLLAALAGTTGRALVLDLDNTLWGGAIGDDGLAGIRLGGDSVEGEAYRAFQRCVLELRARGVVLAVCSKNEDAVAREPFRRHPDMLLRENHIALFQANRLDKATNIRAIAEVLNLGLESLVFVDDDDAERLRVRQALPLVAVPEMGADPAAYPYLLARSGLFEHLALNRDDLRRADSYEHIALKVAIRGEVANYSEYLRSLKMVLTVSRFDEIGRARVAQLGSRYNEEALRHMETDPSLLCWQTHLADVHGAQGMIAVVIVRLEREEWTIDTWLQSCRFLERGVEQTLMNLLMAEARRSGVDRVIGEYVPTDRNGMVADFYERMGFRAAPEGVASGRRFVCSPIDYQPFEVHIDAHVAERLSTGHQAPSVAFDEEPGSIPAKSDCIGPKLR